MRSILFSLDPSASTRITQNLVTDYCFDIVTLARGSAGCTLSRHTAEVLGAFFGPGLTFQTYLSSPTCSASMVSFGRSVFCELGTPRTRFQGQWQQMGWYGGPARSCDCSCRLHGARPPVDQKQQTKIENVHPLHGSRLRDEAAQALVDLLNAMSTLKITRTAFCDATADLRRFEPSMRELWSAIVVLGSRRVVREHKLGPRAQRSQGIYAVSTEF